MTLEGCIKDLGVINVAELQLHATDFGAAGESFDTPAVSARGRGAGRVAGVAAIPGPASMRYLSLVSVLDLEDAGAAQPLHLLTQVVGMLGPCLTRVARADERGTTAIVCNMLRTQLVSAGLGTEDGALVDAVPEFARNLGLPALFALAKAGLDDLRLEAKGMITYHKSDDGRRGVERSRLYSARDGYLAGCVSITDPYQNPRLFKGTHSLDRCGAGQG